MADEPKKSNLVSLVGKKKDVTQDESSQPFKPDPVVVGYVKELLAKAESGELRGIIGFTLEYDKVDNILFNDYVFTGTEILIDSYMESWWMLEKTKDVYKEILVNYENGDF